MTDPNQTARDVYDAIAEQLWCAAHNEWNHNRRQAGIGLIAAALRSAVEQEREALAAECDRQANGVAMLRSLDATITARVLRKKAESIRDRSKQEVKP